MVDSPLLPKICRLNANGDLLDIEKLLLSEFKRTNPLLIEQHRTMDDWDYLTLGQAEYKIHILPSNRALVEIGIKHPGNKSPACS
jgi:hypothetical protein